MFLWLWYFRMRFYTRLTLWRKAAFDGGSLLDLARFRRNIHHLNSLSREMVVLGYYSWPTYSSSASITVSANGIEPRLHFSISALHRTSSISTRKRRKSDYSLSFSSPRASRMAAKGIFLFLCLLSVTNSVSSGKISQWPRHRMKTSMSAEYTSMFATPLR